MQCEHRFVIEILKKDGSSLGQAPVSPENFEPAIEWVRFLGIRQGKLPPLLSGCCNARVDPVWDPEQKAPLIRGFRVALPTAEAVNGSPEAIAREIPRSFFRRLAQEASASLVKEGTKEGKLEKGETFQYTVSAFPSGNSGARATGPSGRLVVEEVAQHLPLDEMPLAMLSREATFHGEPIEEEMPVFIPRRVVDEATALKHEAGDVETGGVLIGHLHRDGDLPEIYVEVSAQIPARHTVAAATRLTFTAETWTAVRGAIELRGGKDIMVGWWHSHPARAPSWCGRCDPSRWKHCVLARSFFSEEDCHLHRTVFPRAYSIALVVGDRPADETWEDTHALFGWHQGIVVARGFHVLGGAAVDASVCAAESKS